jgi:hypothetical protein
LIENTWVPVGAIPCGCPLEVERVFVMGTWLVLSPIYCLYFFMGIEEL